MAVVQAFNREQAFQARVRRAERGEPVSNVYAQKLLSIFFPAIELLGVIATVLVLFAGER